METWSYYSARFLQSLSKYFVDKKVDFRALDSLNFITLTIIFQLCINQNFILFFSIKLFHYLHISRSQQGPWDKGSD